MNNEQPETEAEPKKPGGLTDSIARMTACLEDVYANAKAALDQAQNMNRYGMKWITLSKAVLDFVLANPSMVDIPPADEPMYR